MNPKISVIVPIYNALDDVKLCLTSLKNNFDFDQGEVFLINDCSKQDTFDFLEQFSILNPQFKLIHNQENLGFVKTCNKGMKLSQGEIIVLLNSDTQIPFSFCNKILKCFDSNSNIGIASPIGSYTASYFVPLPQGMNLEQMNSKLKKSHRCSYPIIPMAEGFCFCIRKKVIKDIGYLDEIFGKGYGEECDYSCRARKNGWEIVLIDDLYVYHKRQASFGHENRSKLMQVNDPVFQSRWHDFLENFGKQNNWHNPIDKIREELLSKKIGLPFSYYFLMPNQKYLSIMGCKIFRLKIKIKDNYKIKRLFIFGIPVWKKKKPVK